GTINSCRKCRLKRFSEVLKRADASNYEEIVVKIATTLDNNISSIELRETLECKARTFIDHNTFTLDLPTGTSIPLLDKIRWSYRAIRGCLNRTKSMSRELFNRIKPDHIEFTALLGLAF
ncbi:hypothetical protein PMAYCL1PPCAC_00171, partial [Pristionchus mayeri]